MSVRKEKFRGTEHWRVDVTWRAPGQKPRRIRELAKPNTRQAAKKLEQQILRALQDGTYDRQQKEVPTLAEFAPRFIESYARANRQKHSGVVSKESILKHHLLPRFKDTPLDCITDEDVQALKAALSKKAVKTVNNVLSVLGKLLKVAVKWRVIDEMPCTVDLLKVPPKEMEFYEEEEFERLVEAAAKVDDESLAFVLLGGEAGLRAGEMMGLQWSDLDFKRGHIVVQRTVWRGVEGPPKGGTSRRVPMSPRLAAVLRSIQHLRGPRVFYRDDGSQLTQKTLQVWMERVQRRAGMEVTGQIHRLRHSYGTRLAARGVPARTIQEVMGHRDLTTTQKYLHHSPAALDEVARLFGSLGSAVATTG